MAETETKIAALKSRACIKISGPQAGDFLNNLITCDVLNLKSGELTFGALLTPQGKILFDFFVLGIEGGFLLDTDRDQRDALLKRLTFYKLRAQVDLTADDQTVFAIWGAGEKDGAEDPRSSSLGTRVYGIVLVPNAQESEWHEHRIAIGVPHSGLDFELESVFPHDALMDQFPEAGINFNKGCYVGQEVVSRMQHRGTARNRFMIVASQTDDGKELPEAGTELIAGERTIGKMGSYIGNMGLALVRVDRVAQATDNGLQILVDGQEVILNKPEFATF